MHDGAVEATRFPRNPLDIVAQQLVAMAAMDDWPVDALFATIQGGMTQNQFRTRELPDWMSTESSAVANRAYAIEPAQTWPNANVVLQMQNNQIGLITGQRTVDDVLKAMDAGWKSGTG